MKLSKYMKLSKLLLLSLLAGIALVGVIICAFAWLVMLIWNILGVAALSIAVPLSFWTSLKGVGLLYCVLTLSNILRSVLQGYMQKMQTQGAMTVMRQFDEEARNAQTKKEDDDILKHFRVD